MFSVENQNIISDGGKESINELFRKVLSGRNYSAVIDIGDGLRLVSGSPIDVEGKPVYYLNIPTPFSHILMPVQNLLHTELVLNVIILIAFTAVMSYLVYIMSQWGSKMGKEVKQRTQEIEIANRSLEERAVEMQTLNTDLGNANKKLNNAYEDLKKQDRLQKEFVNIVAHELRTPAQAIIGFIQLIEMNPGNYSLYIERLKRNTSRLERLIQDTLDLARIESETFRLSKEKTDLRELIKNVVEDSDFNTIGRQKNNLSNP
jgi:signal transduction histidine kinase